MDFRFKADFLWDVLNHFETWYPAPFTPVLVLGNHDSRRWIERVYGDTQKAKLIALLQLTARGIPVVYYGEEIGLPEGKIQAKLSLDPVGQRFAWAPNWLLNLLNLYVNRDNCRTPMAWDSSNQGGFTDSDAEPWLPLSAEPRITNTADQTEDPASLLNWYKTLLKSRKSSSALQSGELRLLPRDLSQKGLLGYYRQTGVEKLAVLINMTTNPIEVDLMDPQLILQTGSVSIIGISVKIGGLSGAILQLNTSENF